MELSKTTLSKIELLKSAPVKLVFFKFKFDNLELLKFTPAKFEPSKYPFLKKL